MQDLWAASFKNLSWQRKWKINRKRRKFLKNEKKGRKTKKMIIITTKIKWFLLERGRTIGELRNLVKKPKSCWTCWLFRSFSNVSKSKQSLWPTQSDHYSLRGWDLWCHMSCQQQSKVLQGLHQQGYCLCPYLRWTDNLTVKVAKL